MRAVSWRAELTAKGLYVLFVRYAANPRRESAFGMYPDLKSAERALSQFNGLPVSKVRLRDSLTGKKARP